MGEGVGAKDVSDQIQDEDQLLGAQTREQQQQEQQQAPEEDDGEQGVLTKRTDADAAVGPTWRTTCATCVHRCGDARRV